jgi:hypothetical protein
VRARDVPGESTVKIEPTQKSDPLAFAPDTSKPRRGTAAGRGRGRPKKPAKGGLGRETGDAPTLAGVCADAHDTQVGPVGSNEAADRRMAEFERVSMQDFERVSSLLVRVSSMSR